MKWEITPDWIKQAACRGIETELFFPERGASSTHVQNAKRFCESCAVNNECYNYAMDNNIAHGIWGVTTATERRRIDPNKSWV